MRIPLWLYHINIGTIRVEASYLDRDIIHPDQAFGFMALVWTPKFCIPSRLCIDCSFIVHSLYSLRIRWKTPSATVATCGNLWQPVSPDPRQRIITHLALQSPCSGSVSCICADGTRLAQQLCRNQDGAGRANWRDLPGLRFRIELARLRLYKLYMIR